MPTICNQGSSHPQSGVFVFFVAALCTTRWRRSSNSVRLVRYSQATVLGSVGYTKVVRQYKRFICQCPFVNIVCLYKFNCKCSPISAVGYYLQLSPNYFTHIYRIHIRTHMPVATDCAFARALTNTCLHFYVHSTSRTAKERLQNILIIKKITKSRCNNHVLLTEKTVSWATGSSPLVMQ